MLNNMKKSGFKTILYFLLPVALMSLFLSSCTAEFGTLPKGEYLKKIEQSPNYRDGEFRNLEETAVMTGEQSKIAAWWNFLFAKYPNLEPPKPLPAVKTDLKELNKNEDLLIWLGHSSTLLQINGKKILIDPVIENYASPVSFINKAFSGTTLYTIDDLPDIDYLVISHDHWDHLEYPTVGFLKDKVKAVICPLGIRSHLEYWGFSPEKILDGDWDDHIKVDDILEITVLPARHFSGRFLSANKTLWSGFMFTTPTYRIFYSGDSGFGKHFKKIAKDFSDKKIDLALIENGQYNENWKDIHMFPEEVAEVGTILKAKKLMPLHSGRFALSTHSWNEPFIRLDKASLNKDYQLITPLIGQIVYLDKDNQTFSKWWESSSINGQKQ